MTEPEITYPWWLYVLAAGIILVPLVVVWVFGSGGSEDPIPTVIGLVA